MSKPIIEVKNLSKAYRLGAFGISSLRDEVNYYWDKLRGKKRHFWEEVDAKGMIWSLNDVSFELNRGEKLAIVGKNGAGKSTLLKILSRITEPTKGEAFIRGKVSSLLEVGTGFHPELSGLENIYLNGVTLGMTRKEIKSKVDAIIDFSGMEKFIETPIKRYSSGMSVRLAFAVAAHLDPDILIVDEVLAVGDLSFRKKCIGKMEEVSRDGRTILFVSHDLAVVQSFCDKGIFLENGKVITQGTAIDAVNKYLERRDDVAKASFNIETHPRSNDLGKITRFSHFSILNSKNEPTDRLFFREPMTIDLEVKSEADIDDVIINIKVFTEAEILVNMFSNACNGKLYEFKKGQKRYFRVQPKGFYLNAGNFYVNISILKGSILLDEIKRFYGLEILNVAFKSGMPPANNTGVVFAEGKWEELSMDKVRTN